MKKVWMMALPLVAAFAACSDDDGPKGPVVEYEVITFEDCDFAAGKYSNRVDETGEYAACGAVFKYKDYYGMIGGCVVSDRAEIRDSGSPLEDGVALPADTEHAGADGSDKFCVVHYHSYVDDYPAAFSFDAGVEREIVSLDLMTSSMMYELIKYGIFSSYPAMEDGDYCNAVITGYGADGSETGSVTVNMADFRDGKSYVMSDWTSVDLTPLGKVNKVLFAIEVPASYTIPNTYGYSVCIDNVKIVKETVQE